MIHFTDATGLLGSALAIAAACTRIPGVSRLAPVQRRWLLAGVFAAVLLPLGNLPLAAYLRGAVGDLSIISLILLGAILLRAWNGWGPAPDRSRLRSLIAAVAAVFYPAALGWGGFDPYRMGFGSQWLLVGLLALAGLALGGRLPVLALAIALSVLGWSAGWYESANLWDYLLDPLVSAYAVLALAAQAVVRARGGLQRPR